MELNLKPRAIAVLCALRLEPKSALQLSRMIGDDCVAPMHDLLRAMLSEGLVSQYAFTQWCVGNEGRAYLENNGLCVKGQSL